MTIPSVDLPCRVIERGDDYVVIETRGRRYPVPAHYVLETGTASITVPLWYAREAGVLSSDQCCSVQDVARRFGKCVSWLYQNLPTLEAEGFPRPVSTIGQKRWDPASLDAWFGRHNPARPQPAPRRADEHQAARDRLAVIYGRVA